MRFPFITMSTQNIFQKPGGYRLQYQHHQNAGTLRNEKGWVRWLFRVGYSKPLGYLGVRVIDCPRFGEPAQQLSSRPRGKPLAPANSKLGWFINYWTTGSGQTVISPMVIELSLSRGGFDMVDTNICIIQKQVFLEFISSLQNVMWLSGNKIHTSYNYWCC